VRATTLAVFTTVGIILLVSSIAYSSYLNAGDPLYIANKSSSIIILAGLLLSIFFMGSRGLAELVVTSPMGISAMAMIAVSLALIIPIPSLWGSPIINDYYGYSSILYLISVVLVITSNWLTRNPSELTHVYSDLDQLEGVTVRLKSEEETSRGNEE
jgi:hypothetical protein